MPPRLIVLAAPILLLLQGQAPPAPHREGLSYGTILYGEPVVSDIVPPGVVDLRPGAVIAEQRVEVMGARMALDRAVTIGAPFNHRLAAGDTFRRYRTAEGERWCESGIPGVSFTPPQDERRAIYPGICLVDADADGAFEAVRMLPYDPARTVRTVAIPPVRLRPAPPVTDPRISRLFFFARVRIVSISESEAVLAADFGTANQSRQEAHYEPSSEVRGSIALRAGAAATVSGLTLRVAGQSGAWRIQTTGAFAPWVRLEQGGAAVRAAGYYLPERED